MVVLRMASVADGDAWKALQAHYDTVSPASCARVAACTPPPPVPCDGILASLAARSGQPWPRPAHNAVVQQRLA